MVFLTHIPDHFNQTTAVIYKSTTMIIRFFPVNTAYILLPFTARYCNKSFVIIIVNCFYSCNLDSHGLHVPPVQQKKRMFVICQNPWDLADP